MRRAGRRRAEAARETPRTLREIDYLLQVNDEARQGALRFALEPDGPFIAGGDARPNPPLVDLPRLLSAAEHVTGAMALPMTLLLVAACYGMIRAFTTDVARKGIPKQARIEGEIGDK